MCIRPLLLSAAALLFAPTASAAEASITAISGEPYGVATLRIPLERPAIGPPLPPMEVSSEGGRVLYPMAHDRRVEVERRPSERPVPRAGRGRLLGRLGNLIRELADDEGPLEQTVARQVTFLFRGSEPFQVRLSDSRGEIGVYQVAPREDPGSRDQLLGEWWESYTAAARRQIDSAEYPPWVETYLVAMLAGRLDLPLPSWYADQQPGGDDLVDTLKLVAGASETSDELFRQAAIGRGQPADRADVPVPAPPNWTPDPQRDSLEEVPTEPIASRVPPECFYIRFGSFANYLWFRDLSEEYGGDISRMVTLRGFADDAAERVEGQLSLQASELSRLLGPSVIIDQALIGRDMFLSEGGTIGTLFHTRNAYVLRSSLANDRAARAEAEADVTLKDVQIAGRPVSLLRSPDNRVRSFMVVDGPYILVTNSRTMVERFLEVGETGQSLAMTPTFQLARQYMPLERADTLFAYFSPAMLKGLASPRYLIELRRRLMAESEIALVHLARQVSATEGDALLGVEALVEAGYLPRSVSQRPDGSGVITVGQRVLDSKRGARGTFLPIADVQLESVTAEEARWYSQIAAEYSARFAQVDPIMVGLGRDVLPEGPGDERLNIHAEIAPFRPEKYGWAAEQLGPPTRVAMQFAPDDIVAAQAHVASPQLGPPTHLFAAIKDTTPPEPEEFEGIFSSYWALRSIPGYLGAWPRPGTLDRLPLGLGRGQPVGLGMSRLLGGVYRYTGGGFSVLSFYPDLLRATLPHLAAIDVEDSAQIRAHVGNLANSRLETWINAQLYDEAAETCLAGADFLNMLSRQLKVGPGQAKPLVENVLGTRLQCPLGGQYVYSGELDQWVSTAWDGRSPQPVAPRDYVSPVMRWFRGADVRVTQFADRVVADAVIDLERQ